MFSLSSRGLPTGAHDAPSGRFLMRPILDKYEEEWHPSYSTARLWDDGILDPRQTRDVSGLAFAATLNAPIPDSPAPVFRM